jgi:hypothetical protein
LQSEGGILKSVTGMKDIIFGHALEDCAVTVKDAFRDFFDNPGLNAAISGKDNIIDIMRTGSRHKKESSYLKLMNRLIE